MVEDNLGELMSSIILSLIYVLLGFIFGRVISKRFYEIMSRILKVRIVKEYLGEGTYAIKIIEIISLIFRYIFYLIGVLLAVKQLKIEVAETLTVYFINYLPNLIVGMFFLIVGVMFANLIKRTLKITLSNSGLDELFSDFQPKLLPSNIIGGMVQYFIILISIAVALTQFGLKTELISWLTFTITTIFIIFTFLFFYTSTKPFLPDVIAGMILRNKRYLKVGENVLIEGKEYRVKKIGVSLTSLLGDKEELIIKNSYLIEKLRKKVE